MKNALVVVGSSWGDEGKGHITDLLCSKKENTLNVRFNGGAQASHTVTTPNGERHAFSHFGSGTFVNAPTYLTEDFMINIFRFELERYKLKESFGITPKIYVNSRCNITTLWDMYINQAIESIRGDKRHGSCGMGINETVHRSKYDEYRLTVMDLLDISTLREKLEKIQNEYVPLRLKNKYNLTIEELPKEYQNMLRDFENIDMTIFYASEFVKYCNIVDDYILKRFDTVVFEGAQGLLLDQGYKRFWPNVTTSNTGIQNVMKLLKRTNYKGELQIFYVSRCYTTRHGRGEFPTEVNGKPYKKIVDLTNIPNEFQESLRFGILDLDLLIESISEDLKKLIFPAKVCMFFTCFDQLDDYAKYVYENTEKSVSKKTFLSEISSIITKNIADITEVFATNGETRNDVIKCTF